MTQIPMYPAQPDSPDFEVQVDITASDTDITFISLTGLLAAPNTLTIRQDDNDTTPETVYYATDPAGDTLTVTRGYGGTTAKDFTAGALACRAHTAYDHNTNRANILDSASTISGILTTISGLAVDSTVFHKATAGEINALTLKATPAAADVLMIEDSAGAVFDKKKIAISTLPFQTVLTNPVTGLATPFVSGDVITGTGTGNQVQDSGVLLSSLAPLSSPTFTNTPAAPTAPNGTQTTQIATTAFVQNAISYLDPLLYKGVIDCSGNPNYPAADAGNLYIASVSGKIGGASGKAVLVGDMILCNHDGTSAGDEAAVGIYWNAIQANMGAVIGPASSTDGHLVLFDGTSGKSVKDGGAVPVVPAFDTTATNIKINGTQSAGSSGLIPNSDHVHPTDTSRAAATALGTWAAFNLNPVWPGATPTITSIVARFVKNGNVVTFAATINVSDGNNAIMPTLDLPVATPQIAGHSTPLTSMKLWIDGDGAFDVSDPFAFINQNAATPGIEFRIPDGSLPIGCSAVLNIAGSYEVPT